MWENGKPDHGSHHCFKHKYMHDGFKSRDCKTCFPPTCPECYPDQNPKPPAESDEKLPVDGKRHPQYDINVFPDGRVWSNKLGRFLKPFYHGAPHAKYPSVAVRVDGKTRSKKVGHLVLETFVGPRPEGYHAAHLDGNKDNSSLSNMRWVTPTENESHKILHGTKAVGEKHGSSKLTEADVAFIRSSDRGTANLAVMFGVSKRQILNIVNAENWKSPTLANDPRVTKIGENVTTENVSNENVSNESDEKLPAFGTLALSVERTNPLEWATAAAKASYNLARANPVEDPRVTELVEALQDAQESLAGALEDMQHYRDQRCLPTEDEIEKVGTAELQARKTLRKFERRDT
ncbi:MAG: HNH endonuclease [Bdellovibrionaceae bacterium]|nr:HNH endonuclease [Pseudobdellovibrionaceae bacterium]